MRKGVELEEDSIGRGGESRLFNAQPGDR